MPKVNQEDIAQALGCTQAAVSRWLMGQNMPHKIFRQKLAELFPEQYKTMMEKYEHIHNRK